MKRFVVALLLLMPAVCAQTGRAQSVTIVDGNTLQVNGETWRLLGSDAPDARQTCDDGYPAGQEATRALRALVQGRKVACERHGQDNNGHSLGLCRADGRDLGEAMVRAGMAWADPHTGRTYADVEHDAQGDRLGVHDHVCILAWKWRASPR